MKRLFCLCLILVLLGASASAAEFASAFDLWNRWSTEGMPDWVCSVSSTDGSMENLTFIVKAGEDEARLRALVEDSASMTVIVSPTAYTDRELQQAHAQIVGEFLGSGSAVTAVGIGWRSEGGEVVGFGESGKESRVVVSVLAEEAEAYRTIFRERWGDLVYVEAVDSRAMPAMETSAAAPAPGGPWVLPAAGGLLVLGGVFLCFGLRNRKNKSEKKVLDKAE